MSVSRVRQPKNAVTADELPATQYKGHPHLDWRNRLGASQRSARLTASVNFLTLRLGENRRKESRKPARGPNRSGAIRSADIGSGRISRTWRADFRHPIGAPSPPKMVGRGDVARIADSRVSAHWRRPPRYHEMSSRCPGRSIPTRSKCLTWSHTKKYIFDGGDPAMSMHGPATGTTHALGNSPDLQHL